MFLAPDFGEELALLICLSGQLSILSWSGAGAGLPKVTKKSHTAWVASPSTVGATGAGATGAGALEVFMVSKNVPYKATLSAYVGCWRGRANLCLKVQTVTLQCNDFQKVQRFYKRCNAFQKVQRSSEVETLIYPPLLLLDSLKHKE